MNREEFNEAIRALNPHLEDAAGALIRLTGKPVDLSGPPYYFVPVGNGLYEILKPSDRGGFFNMSRVPFGEKFVGTLDEAYQRVFDERLSMREQRLAAIAEARARDEGAGHDPEGRGHRRPASHTPVSSNIIERITFIADDGELVDGLFATPAGTPFEQLSLPPDRLGPNTTTVQYEVIKPLPPQVQQGKIAPWFAQPGGGTQYYFPEGIKDYVDLGYLKEWR